jgi:hypothetical protein
MTPHAAINAVVSLALMLTVIVFYLVLARRFRILWNPLAIVVAVGTFGVVVSVLGEVLFRGSTADVPAMLRRSAIGSFGWGVVIASVVWIARRVFARSYRSG